MNLTGFSRHYQVQENLTHCSDLEVLLCSPPVFSLCFPFFYLEQTSCSFQHFKPPAVCTAERPGKLPVGSQDILPSIPTWPMLFTWFLPSSFSLNLTWVLPPLLLHCHAESTQFLVVNFQPSLQGAHNTQRNHF